MSLSETDLQHLRHCVELAREALDDGDEPFGSVLVSGAGEVLYADRNRVKDGDQTRHPEFDIARWAGEHLPQAERAACTVYTSGEHCPMCSAAHAWVGLGRIVYAVSGAQLGGWLTEWGVAPGPVTPMSVQQVAPGVPVDGPAPELEAEVRALHARLHGVAGMTRPALAEALDLAAASRGRLVPPDLALAGRRDAARRPGAPDRDADLLPAAGRGVVGLAQGRLRRALDGARRRGHASSSAAAARRRSLERRASVVDADAPAGARARRASGSAPSRPTPTRWSAAWSRPASTSPTSSSSP